MAPTPVDMSTFPKWPAHLRSQHFSVTFEVVIGKDGRVASAKPVSGPTDAYKACEEAIRKWKFKPYLVLGKPVELVSKLSCNNN